MLELTLQYLVFHLFLNSFAGPSHRQSKLRSFPVRSTLVRLYFPKDYHVHDICTLNRGRILVIWPIYYLVVKSEWADCYDRVWLN